MRVVRWYQFSTSDIRSIGAAQAAATIFAAVGTFALSHYLDLSKDIALAGEKAPEYLINVASFAFWSCLISWLLAFVAFVWQGLELNRVKQEHGEASVGLRFSNLWRWMKGNGNG